jgi:hypothetical protein
MSHRFLLALLLLALVPASAAAAPPLWGLERPKITGTMDLGQQLTCRQQRRRPAGHDHGDRSGFPVGVEPGDPPPPTHAPTPAPSAKAGAPHATKAPKLARVGKRLTCSAGNWTGAPKLSYGWKRDGKAIKGQTASRYTIRKADRRKALTCAVTAKNAGGTKTVTTRAIRIK